ncbi:ABC transporter substrate-binding protein [Paraburkholderia sp. MPAMCS5]|nr:ABC transporter substrate-binding protein [Paraburkholderia sp. MPAMCS5]
MSGRIVADLIAGRAPPLDLSPYAATAPFAYDAALAMIKAIHDADSLDRAKIVERLSKVTVTGVTGHITFDPYGDLIMPPYTLFQVQEGQWKRLRTVGGSGL